jgi:hypothetical protein
MGDVVTDIADNRSGAVVRTRLPYTDRRSLSQAWFSALHLADAGVERSIPSRRAGDPPFPRDGIRASNRKSAAAAPVRLPAATARAVASNRLDPQIDLAARRTRSREAVKRAELAFDAARSYPPFRTSFTVGVDGARIKLLLRRAGPTLHVIALCAPAHVDLVRRALARADAHLRCGGESVRASVLAFAALPV